MIHLAHVLCRPFRPGGVSLFGVSACFNRIFICVFFAASVAFASYLLEGAKNGHFYPTARTALRRLSALPSCTVLSS